MPKLILPGMVTRRTLLQAAATTGGAVLAAVPLATPAVWAASPTLKIGYVTPATGPLAGFAEADDFNIALFRTLLKNGLKVGGKTYAIEIVVKDSQSNPNRAAQVAKDLIVQDKSTSCWWGGRLRRAFRSRRSARSRKCRASPRIARGRRGSSGARATRPIRNPSTTPTISSGASRTSSPPTPTCGVN